MMRPEDVPESAVLAMAEALNRYETSGLCPMRGACDLCDCGADMQTPERTEEGYRHALGRARYALAAVLPEIQAQALEEAADYCTTKNWTGPDATLIHLNQWLRDRADRLTSTTEEGEEL